MRSVALSPAARESALEAMASTELDVLVVGGGVVGAGSALDAATRGLTVGLVEARDFASGTSSRSSSGSFEGGAQEAKETRHKKKRKSGMEMLSSFLQGCILVSGDDLMCAGTT